jgi:hypothetical protein
VRPLASIDPEDCFDFTQIQSVVRLTAFPAAEFSVYYRYKTVYPAKRWIIF